MPKRRTVLSLAAISLLFSAPALAQDPPESFPKRRTKQKGHEEQTLVLKKPKYYFKIHEVNVGKHGDAQIAKIAREGLEKELQSRPEFTSELGGVTDDAAVLDELKKRGLKGFRASVRLDRLTKNLKDPKPGGRLKQLSVDVKLSVFGTTFPGEKLAFSGDGETVIEAEVVEQQLEEEGLVLAKEVIPQALKQAVDQAVAKLSAPKSAPLNESKRRRPR